MFARSLMLGLTWSALALVPMRAPDLPEQRLPIYGGSGGTAFSRSCGSGRVLTGVRLRTGLEMDAIGLLCRPVNADGTLGSQTTVGTLAGGGGGTSSIVHCGTGNVVTGARIYYGGFVSAVALQCQAWSASARGFTGAIGGTEVGGRSVGASRSEERCEASTQPVVAIRGRAEGLVDALGFTCNEP